MAILGFRRPQFSEEEAWLPEWLQNSQAASFDKLTNESEEVQVAEENGDERKASEEGRYDNCHLYLSGTDKSASSLTSLSSNVLHLNLHLSSDGSLQYSQIPCLNNIQVETAKITKSRSEEVTVPVEVGKNATQLCSHEVLGTPSLVKKKKPTTTENPDVIPESPFIKEITRLKKMKDGPPENGSFDHAVELSIAASEALLIHELLENEENSEVVKASALLDISLQVKRARLLWVEEKLLSTDHLDGRSECLSDLDDSAMIDAFVDVGLCCTPSGECYLSDKIISHVNESPQTNPEAGCNCGQSEFLTFKASLNYATDKFPENYLDLNREVKFRDGDSPELKSDSRGLEFTAVQQAGFIMPTPEVLPTQLQLAANSSQSQDHMTSEDCQLKHSTPDGLNGCWFGGWTTKDDCHGLTFDTKTFNAKALAVETSSLSESVDVPEKSSYVNGHESKLFTSFKTCTAADIVTLANMIEDGELILQEMAKHTSSLSIDPLCSVVPCTYQSETPQSMHNGHFFQKGGEDLDKNKPFLASRRVPDGLNLMSEQTVRFQAATTVNHKNSNLNVQELEGSLNKYSVALDSWNEIGTALITREQLLVQCDSGNECCPSKSKNYTHNAYGNTSTTSPYLKPTSATTPSIKDQPLMENLTKETALCNKNAMGEKKILTPLGALEGLCTDKELVIYTASQRVLDGSAKHRETHDPSTETAQDIQVLGRKRVHFKEDTTEIEQSEWLHLKKRKITNGLVSNLKYKMLRTSNLEPGRETLSQEVKKKLTNHYPSPGDKMIFHGLEFLLTGLPKKQENEVKQLIIRYGGIVLFDIPSLNLKRKIRLQPHVQKLPVVLCLQKVETTKFLYGCAVSACILKVDWLLDSISVGSVLQPEKYMIFSKQADEHQTIIRSPHACKLVFEGVGIMFHGKHQFCTRLSKIFKFGGGRVFKSLQQLVQSSERKKLTVQVIVAQDRSTISRHLKHCAIESNIPIVSATWIKSSLLSGKLLPFAKSDYNLPKPLRKASQEMQPTSSCLSQEI